MRSIISIGVLLIMLTSFIMLTSCTYGGPTGGYAFIDASIEPISDRSGLIMIQGNRDENNPAQTTYGSIITLENRMLAPASNVMVEVSNVNPSIIDFSSIAEHRVDLAGFEDREGGEWFDVHQFSVEVVEPKREYSTQIRYHLCAQSETRYQGTICMAPPMSPHLYQRTCAPEVLKIQGGQQAPVAVTEIRQADSVSATTIFIDVVNFGTGLVFDYSDTCARIPQEDAGHITLTSLTIGGEDVTSACSQRRARMGYTQEYQKHTGTTFTCIIDKSELRIADWDEMITTDVSVAFSYGYHVIAATQPIIIRVI